MSNEYNERKPTRFDVEKIASIIGALKRKPVRYKVLDGGGKREDLGQP